VFCAVIQDGPKGAAPGELFQINVRALKKPLWCMYQPYRND